VSRGVVLITGASSGLGEEMARQFAALGYDLALCARRTVRVDTLTGVRSMVTAIEKRRPKAYVPAWPWVPIGAAMRVLPLSVVRRLT
jgi:NAD(P)-dependent dehydrogenase (short-subunit alcohol dehydrogenase family)